MQDEFHGGVLKMVQHHHLDMQDKFRGGLKEELLAMILTRLTIMMVQRHLDLQGELRGRVKEEPTLLLMLLQLLYR